MLPDAPLWRESQHVGDASGEETTTSFAEFPTGRQGVPHLTAPWEHAHLYRGIIRLCHMEMSASMSVHSLHTQLPQAGQAACRRAVGTENSQYVVSLSPARCVLEFAYVVLDHMQRKKGELGAIWSDWEFAVATSSRFNDKISTL